MCGGGVGGEGVAGCVSFKDACIAVDVFNTGNKGYMIYRFERSNPPVFDCSVLLSASSSNVQSLSRGSKV